MPSGWNGTLLFVSLHHSSVVQGRALALGTGMRSWMLGRRRGREDVAGWLPCSEVCEHANVEPGWRTAGLPRGISKFVSVIV